MRSIAWGLLVGIALGFAGGAGVGIARTREVARESDAWHNLALRCEDALEAMAATERAKGGTTP